eukprot:2408961-Pyramimonas_sp.AAC.1
MDDTPVRSRARPPVVANRVSLSFATNAAPFSPQRELERETPARAISIDLRRLGAPHGARTRRNYRRERSRAI